MHAQSPYKMDEFLKGLARLDGFELQLYARKPGGVKKPKPLNEQNVVKIDGRRRKRQVEDEDFKANVDFPNACEAEYYKFKKLKQLQHQFTIEYDSSTDEEPCDNLCSRENEIVTDPVALAKISHNEVLVRSERGKENKITRLLDRPLDLLQSKNLLKIFASNLDLEAETDSTIREKLSSGHLDAFITLASFSSIYGAIKDFLASVFVEIGYICKEIELIWPRKRTQSSIKDIASDLKRLRNVKAKNPELKLSNIFQVFNHKEDEFLSVPGLCEEIVKSALKRMGANNYGPSRRFAQVINLAFSDNEDEDSTIHDHNDDDDDEEDKILVEDFDKIQEAIKKTLAKKVNKTHN